MNKMVAPFSAPAIIMPIALKGHLECWHYSAEKRLWTKRISKPNSIHSELKAIIRDNLVSTTDFALDNLFATDGQIFGGGGHAAGDPIGKDGIIVFDSTNTYWLTTITAVHPTDPSGSYYRQWQGVLTNDFGAGSFVLSNQGGTLGAMIGVDLDGNNTFGYTYALQVFDTDITMAANDILTTNWKITVG